MASADYLRTVGVPILEGRGLEAGDRDGSVPVAVVNQAFRRIYLSGGEAVGQRIQLQGEEEWRTVVGVVGNVLHWQLSDPPAPEIYVPLAQYVRGTMTMAVRGSQGEEWGSLGALLRREVRAVDGAQPVYDLASLEELMANSMMQQTVTLVLMAIFGLAALLLAVLGLYGVITYAVVQRTPEIGIRMAVGASKSDVVRLVLRQGMGLVGLGTVLGLVVAFGAGHLASALLFGVEPTDPWSYTAVTLLLFLAGVAGCSAPARKATEVDPLATIRRE